MGSGAKEAEPDGVPARARRRGRAGVAFAVRHGGPGHPLGGLQETTGNGAPQTPSMLTPVALCINVYIYIYIYI